MTDARQLSIRLTGRALTVVAVVMALLAMSAQPVAASHGELAVGSEHSSASGFSQGTFTNTTVDGTGASGLVSYSGMQSGIEDGFEDGNLNEYTAYGTDTAGWTTGGTPKAGSTAGVYSGDGSSNIEFLKRGATSKPILIKGWVRAPDNWVGYQVASDATATSGLELQIGPRSDTIKVYDRNNNTALASKPVTLAADTYYYLALYYNPQTGELDAWVDDDAAYQDDPMQSIQTSAPTYSKTSYGLWVFDDTTGNYLFDNINYQTGHADSGRYVGANHSVSNVVNAWANLSLQNATATVEWEGWTGAQWQVVNSSQFDSTGNYTLDISGTSYDKWRVNVSFEKTGSNPTAKLHDEGILVETSRPEIDDSSLSPNSTDTSTDESVTLSADISDPDFDIEYGDTATVHWFVDGEQRATTSASSNGTVSYTLSNVDAGSHDWHIEVEDEFGHRTTSATAQFTSPSEIRIYDEMNPDQLVKDSVTVTVRLYAEDRTVKREVSDGVLDMSGLPVDSTIVATTEADGWIDRRILIRDLTQQQQIYLLNSSADSVPITFDLQDKTGDFPDDTSQLYVQKAINTSGTEDLEWKTVTGDYFGADGTFPTDLAYNHRYRLVIRNEGKVRVLGSYIPTESGTYPVEIGNIVWDVPEGESVYADSELRDLDENTENTYPNATKEMYFEYFDSTGNTSELHINISVRGSNEIIYETTVYDVSSYSESVPLTKNQSEKSLVVNVTADRTADDDFEHVYQHGVPDGPDLPGDPNLISLGAQVTLLALIGLVAGSMPKKGGLVVVPVAFGITWLGLWEIHPAALGISGVIALFAAARSQGGGGY